MVQLLALLIVAVSSLISHITAFPTGPGTCLVSGMSGNPHGAVATAGSYGISIKSAGGTSYTITISGSGNYTGLLFYGTDTAGNKTRFGSFTKTPTGLGPHLGCGGTNPASNTVGHIIATVKTFPISLTWTPDGYGAGKSVVASFTGIVMTSNAKIWHVLGPQTATIAAGNTTTNATSSVRPSSASASSSSPTATLSLNSSSTDMGNGTAPTESASSSASARGVASSFALVALLTVAALFT